MYTCLACQKGNIERQNHACCTYSLKHCRICLIALIYWAFNLVMRGTLCSFCPTCFWPSSEITMQWKLMSSSLWRGGQNNYLLLLSCVQCEFDKSLQNSTIIYCTHSASSVVSYVYFVWQFRYLLTGVPNALCSHSSVKCTLVMCFCNFFPSKLWCLPHIVTHSQCLLSNLISNLKGACYLASHSNKAPLVP